MKKRHRSEGRPVFVEYLSRFFAQELSRRGFECRVGGTGAKWQEGVATV